MKKNNPKIIVGFIIITLLILSSCSKDDHIPTPQPYQATQLPDDITDLFIAKGDLNADTVWIYEQGGPDHILEESDLEAFPNSNNYLNVYMHQVLTYNNDLYNKNLTKEQAEQETLVNDEILDTVIQHFKNQGKTVIVIGHSYGAFVVTHYLSKKGSSSADKFVIMAGRLNIDEVVYNGAINGQFYDYPDAETPVLSSIQPNGDKQKITQLLLLGVIGQERYVEELSNVDLSNVIYAFANDDDALGKLSTVEKDFLISKNVEVVEIASGGHGAMFDSPNNQIIYDLMIQ